MNKFDDLEREIDEFLEKETQNDVKRKSQHDIIKEKFFRGPSNEPIERSTQKYDDYNHQPISPMPANSMMGNPMMQGPMMSGPMMAGPMMSPQMMPQQAEKPPKTFAAFMADAVFYLVLVAIVVGAFIYTSNKQGVASIFGYSPMIVLTSSMEPEIPRDALIINKETDPKEIQIDDDITFMVNDEGDTFTHRVVDKFDPYKDTDEIGFKTMGIASGKPDKDIAMAPNVVGVVKFVLPNVGIVFSWLKGKYIYVVILLFLILALSFTLKMYLKAERDEKIQKEQEEFMKQYYNMNR